MSTGGYLKARLAETFPTPPSDPTQPLAYAVGMRRRVTKNRSEMDRCRSEGVVLEDGAHRDGSGAASPDFDLAIGVRRRHAPKGDEK